MRIVSLRFQNLNSLYGEWQVDFQHPDFVNNGLFAITGPTGAGKSTILDAICLALFGQTPRLSNINKSENEIMSRHSGMCMAEVVFAIGGRSYRSTWSQSRARNRPSGKLQDAKHELADADSGQIIEEKKSRTLQAIEQLTHLNFQRFTRSVLLAQGSFAAFLQASVGERSDMLQQITGTEIYELISKQVHHNKRHAEDALQLLQSAAQGIVVMGAEEAEQLQQGQRQLVLENQQQQQQLQQLRQQHAQQQRQQHLIHTLNSLRQQQQTHQHQHQLFAPKATQLQQALRAAELAADHRTLTHTREQSAQLRQAQQDLQDALPALRHRQQHSQQQWAEVQTQQQQFQQQLQQQQQLWQQVSAMDARIAAEHQRDAEWQQQIQQQQNHLERAHTQWSQLQQQQTQQQTAWAQLRCQMDADADLAIAAALLPQWQQQWVQIQALTHTAQEQQQYCQAALLRVNDNEQAQQEQVQYQTHTTQRQALLQQSQANTEQQLAQLLAGKTVSEYELEQTLLQQQQRLLDKIHSLEAERGHLRDGHACPLCGALSHPYVQDQQTLPMQSSTETRLHELKVFFTEVAEHQRSLQQWQLNANNLQQQLDMRLQDHQRLLSDAKRLHSEHQLTQNKLQHTQQQLQAVLQPLEQAWAAHGHTAGTDPQLFLQPLQQRVSHWQTQQQQAQAMATDLDLLNKDAKLAQQQCTEAQALLQQQQHAMQAHSMQWQASINERQQCFGDTTIAADQHHWQQQQLTWQQRLQDAQAKSQHAQTAYQQQQVRLDDQRHLQQQLQTQLQLLETQWLERLLQQGFATELLWAAQQLPTAECTALQQQQQQLQQQGSELALAIKHTETELAILAQSLAHTEPPTEGLEEQIQQLQDAYAHTSQQIGATQQQLQQQQLALERLAEHAAHIQVQQQECQRWRSLHELIGSSDGKKYRLFAQSLTFNHLIAQANAQLQSMSERYLLKQNEATLLQLDVVDQYQGGAVRSAKNLSGGESFIVSLALALGLARMSSQTTRIDSLFLDEGFGTLDEDALEVALNALAQLQQEGKLIGVISHVSALKERISTQIGVEPQHNGHSVLRGSGVGRPATTQ